jgi:hypothetical protein
MRDLIPAEKIHMQWLSFCKCWPTVIHRMGPSARWRCRSSCAPDAPRGHTAPEIAKSKIGTDTVTFAHEQNIVNDLYLFNFFYNEPSSSGANPTIMSYNASVVKCCDAARSLGRFVNENISFDVLCKNVLVVEFKSRWIGSWGPMLWF